MKRFHVHISVDNLDKSVNFYRNLFGQLPTKQQRDYAKWVLEDPPVNFAISARGQTVGVNHFGMQVETQEELASLKVLADQASAGATLDEGETICCYANSEKHWTIDPQGVPWEHFLTMSDAITYGEDSGPQPSACCARSRESGESTEHSVCRVPQVARQDQAKCCR